MITKIDDGMLSKLPENLRIAQKAIESKEVQDIIEQLGKYNLGVCMPHMHTQDNKFGELPKHTVQVERKLVTSFIPASEVDSKTMIPVMWRWVDGVVVSASSCHYCDQTA